MTAPVREEIEWVNFRWDHAQDTSRPRVLLIGDSIANGYHGTVSASLKDRFNVDLLATSKCVADPAFVRETRFAMEEYEHALIHFNNGLHGGHLSETKYEAGLRAYIHTLKELAPDTRLIWASSTPVRAADGSLNPQRNPQVVVRNEAAGRVVGEYRIPVDDLYGLVVDSPELFAADGVHYGEEGKIFLGESVTAFILAILAS